MIDISLTLDKARFKDLGIGVADKLITSISSFNALTTLGYEFCAYPAISPAFFGLPSASPNNAVRKFCCWSVNSLFSFFVGNIIKSKCFFKSCC